MKTRVSSIAIPCIAFALLAATGTAIAAQHANLNKNLEPLSFFLGHWTCAGHFPNGKSITSHKTFTSTLNGHWLKMKHKDNPPGKYQAIELWGYDSGRFTVYLYDNFGGVRHYRTSGWKRNKLVLHNTATKGYTDRFSFKRSSDSSYQVAYTYKGKTGKWKQSDTLTCTRVLTSYTIKETR